MKKNRKAAALTAGPAAVWFLVFVVIPIAYVIGISFLEMRNRHFVAHITLKNYASIFSSLYLSVYARSFMIAFFNTVICILLGYPYAFLIARSGPKKRRMLTNLMMIPLYTNSIVRLGGWKDILDRKGYLNTFLMNLGLIREPITFMYTNGAVIFGMVYILLPFMVLPLVSSIGRLDWNLIEASYDLGGNRRKTFFRVMLPLTRSGLFSGSIMVFVPTMAYYYISDFMGGAKHKLIGNTIQTQFQESYNWPLGAAFSVILLLMTLVLILIYSRGGGKKESIELM
ncbi:MAG: ABC transporter permease [Bilifractor sp.]|jgi:spermidine/putrescine transport system permease protein